jgi:phospholipid/cholesterol/gamma-HCH transport system substrate-binding protein
MEYRKTEVRAGIFLMTAFVVFAVMVFAVSDIPSLFQRHKEIKAHFAASEGLDRNAQVRFSGIKIGTVTGIRVAHEKGDRVELTLNVFSDAVIREDASASIKTLGLIGKKYVEISGGTPGARPLPPGGALIGKDALTMEDLTKAGLDVVEKVRHIAQNLDRLLGDPSLARGINGTLQNVEAATANIRTMTENKEQVGEAMRSLPDIMKKVDADLANLKTVMEKTEGLLGQAQTLVGRTDATLAENRRQIDATMVNMKDISQNLKEMTEDVKQHPWKLIRKP